MMELEFILGTLGRHTSWMGHQSMTEPCMCTATHPRAIKHFGEVGGNLGVNTPHKQTQNATKYNSYLSLPGIWFVSLTFEVIRKVCNAF